MSGITSDNTDKQSGLIKTPVLGPSSGSSNPGTDENPSAVGDRFINTTSGELFVTTDVTTDKNVWKGQLGTDVEPPTWYGGRGVWAGGYGGARDDEIDYVAIGTTGDATDFGNLTEAKELGGTGASNGTRGVVAGGNNGSAKVNVMEYVTIGTTSNGTDFGDLSATRYNGIAAASNGTRGVFLGGSDSGATPLNIMEYITNDTTGDAADFGDLTVASDYGGGCSDFHGGLQG